MNGNAQTREDFVDNKTVEDYVKDVMGCVRGCQKLSSDLAGWHHYQDYSGVVRVMDQVNSLLTSLVSKIFSHQDIRIGLARHKLLDQFDMIREGNDALLERINSDVDEASGLKKNADAELLEPNVLRKVEGPSASASGKNMVLLASRTVQKPQLFFAQKVDNSHKRPFLPPLTEKPNNLKPLSILLCIDEAGNDYYSHPYEYELQHRTVNPSQLEPVTPQLPKPIEETPIIMVDNEDDLKKMVNELKECNIFGFDVENHSYRTYQGLTCLLQISTRDMDYIIDPFALRDKLTILNEVFTDPKIIKVAHGADHDVLWLQRDCGVYIVNLFDTHQAAVVLEYPHRSLSALLSRFCGIEANKVYQRADWRIRPLPEDFINYARQDSHNLPYIYDLMTNELIEKGNQLKNLITAVYSRSTEICMKRYEKPLIGPESHMEMYRRSRKSFNSRQIFALQALYLWRDRIAREQDESVEYVLPKHMLLQIAEVLPKDMQGILACCNPIPPLVKTELLTIHTLLRQSRQQQLTDIKPSSFDTTPFAGDQSSEDQSIRLISKHDFSQCDENPTDLPCLLNPGENLLGDLFTQHKINVVLRELSQMFGCIKNEIQHLTKDHYEISKQFISPYERYTTYCEMKPYIEGEKKKGADQDRIKRIMDHFITLTANTETEKEDEIDPRTKAIHQEDEDRPPQVIPDEVISLKQKEAEKCEVVKSVERKITHQAIDSFLEAARSKSQTQIKTDDVNQLLSHFRNLAGESAMTVTEEDAASDESEDSTPQPVKRRKRPGQDVLVLGDQVKKSKGRSKKRQSSAVESETSPKKLKKEGEKAPQPDNEGKDEVLSDAEDKEVPDGKDGKLPDVKAEELPDADSEELSDADSEENEDKPFDYNDADYSIFKKSKRKANRSTHFRQKFRGKKDRKRV